MCDPPEATPEAPQPPPVSLRELSEAFAQAMGGQTAEEADPQDHGAPPPVDSQTAPQEGPAPPPAEAAPDAPNQPADDDDPCRISPLTILEAMLFVGDPQNEPLTPVRAAELMRGVEPEEIAGLVEHLNRRYEATGCPYEVVSQGRGYRLTLRSRFAPLRNRFYGRVREAQLSQAAIDILAIVAYRQPLTAEQVSKLRDRPSSHLLAQLVRRQLLRIELPKEKPRKASYYTTDRFLELFSLESIDDLPQAEEELQGR